DRSAVTFQAVMTKADKVSKAELEKNIDITRAALAKHPAAFPELIVTSAEKGLGVETLRATIATLQ
ncbi:MAG: YihA family ribosome biogenesis GTP-binding protein, partial [Pseudorhodobacter sp.]|nr:YihA family ribosome biogenesis GTP-binding protein [Pseudorhodobacter sp.]